jgi:hypothetical protein
VRCRSKLVKINKKFTTRVCFATPDRIGVAMRKYILLTVCLLLIANLVVGVQLLQKPNVTAEIPAEDGAVALVRPWFIDQAMASEDRDARAIAIVAAVHWRYRGADQ